MSERRKRVGFLRIVGSLILALLLSALLLGGFHLFYSNVMQGSALSLPFYTLAGIVAAVFFLLLLFPANRPMRGFKTFVRWLLIIVLGLGLFSAGTIWLIQDEQLYFPKPYTQEDLSAVQALTQLEAVSVPGKDGKEYKGWLWHNAQAPAGLIIYFGGNGQYAASTLRNYAGNEGASQIFQGYNLMMIDYPGYGGSDGTPTEGSIFDMAQATWDYALTRPEVIKDRIVLMGWSLGTGPATMLAAAQQPRGLILLAPFLNGAELLNDYVGAPIFDGNGRVLVRNRFESDVYAQETQSQALIIAGKTDSMIPAHQAESLAALYPKHKLVVVEGGHNDVRTDPQAVSAIYNFLQELLAP